MRNINIINKIKETNPKLLSLDVFDTILFRNVQSPDCIFSLCYDKIIENGYQIKEKKDHFIQNRIDCEKEARKGKENGEINLFDIASLLSTKLLGISPSDLVRLEIQSEMDRIEINPDIIDVILYAHKININHIFISDMYLRSSDIKNLIEIACVKKRVIIPNELKIFVSNEYSDNKSKSLIIKACNELNVQIQNLLHIGDNKCADYDSPLRIGANAIHYKQDNSYITNVQSKEKLLNKPKANDYDFGIMAARKLSFDHTEEKLNFKNYGAFIFGPIFSSFSEWVLKQCDANCYKKVFCLMREGEFLSNLLNVFSSAKQMNILFTPLWVSRYALKSSNINTLNDVVNILNTRKKLNNIEIAKILNINLNILNEKTQADPASKLSSEQIAFIANLIWSDETLRKQVIESSEVRKERLLLYLKKAGFFDQDKNVILDLGWQGNIQKSLTKLCVSDNPNAFIHGIYLGTHGNINSLPLKNSFYSSFLYEAGIPVESFCKVIRSPEILEQVCMPNLGSLKEFSADGVPILFDNKIPACQVLQIKEIQDGILKFVEIWLKCQSGFGNPTFFHYDELKENLRNILVRSIESPTQDEVELLSDWVHDDNNGSDSCESIFGSFDFQLTAKTMNISGILNTSFEDCMWPQGLVQKIMRNDSCETTSFEDCISPQGFVQEIVRNDSYEISLSEKAKSYTCLKNRLNIPILHRFLNVLFGKFDKKLYYEKHKSKMADKNNSINWEKIPSLHYIIFNW
jgi:predicted HAD superfamily hydrolase